MGGFVLTGRANRKSRSFLRLRIATWKTPAPSDYQPTAIWHRLQRSSQTLYHPALCRGGYRPEKNLAHYRTLQALSLIMGDERQGDADYLDSCRTKRNTAEYDSAGHISTEEARELIEFATELRETVRTWLEEKHPELL